MVTEKAAKVTKVTEGRRGEAEAESWAMGLARKAVAKEVGKGAAITGEAGGVGQGGVAEAGVAEAGVAEAPGHGGS